MSAILRPALLTLLFVAAPCVATAQGSRMKTPGNGPGGVPETVFLAHRISSDHAEGITTLDVNGDGFVDLVSGAYWYENPGAQGGDWKQHQLRSVGIHDEFVSDCGEWTIDVNHDGAPASAGTQFVAEDLDHDGDIDTAGKLGMHFLESLKVVRVPKTTREAQQPIERKWPFPGEGVTVQQENGPAGRSADKGAHPQ